MKKIFFIIFVISLTLGSCAKQNESPVIYLSNASAKPIKEIECMWAEKYSLTLPILYPGDSRSQSVLISDSDKFFGLVNLSWINDEGNKITREFFFNKENLPSINDKTTYNYVQIYFDQNGYEVLSSDAADLSNKTQRMDQLLMTYRKEFTKNIDERNKSQLIRVEKPRDIIPQWLNSSY